MLIKENDKKCEDMKKVNDVIKQFTYEDNNIKSKVKDNIFKVEYKEESVKVKSNKKNIIKCPKCFKVFTTNQKLNVHLKKKIPCNKPSIFILNNILPNNIINNNESIINESIINESITNQSINNEVINNEVINNEVINNEVINNINNQ